VNTRNINLISFAGIGVMAILLLSAWLALPFQFANGKQQQQQNHEKTIGKQSIIQENRCKQNANCLNVICMKNSVCRFAFGHDTPFLLPIL
jgi:hypothetical protein